MVYLLLSFKYRADATTHNCLSLKELQLIFVLFNTEDVTPLNMFLLCPVYKYEMKRFFS